MPTVMTPRQFDPELDPITKRRLFAQALRKQGEENMRDQMKPLMVSGHFIGQDQRADVLGNIAGSIMDAYEGRSETKLGASRDQQFQDALRNAPSVMNPGLVTPEGNNPDEAGQGSYQAPDTMKSPDQFNTEMQGYGNKMMGIRDPRAQAMGAQVLTQTLNHPYKQMERKDASDIRKDEFVEKAKEAERVRAEKRDDEYKVRMEKNDEAEARRWLEEQRMKEAATQSALDRIALKQALGGGSGGEDDLGKTQLKGYSANGLPVIYSPKKSMTYELQADGTKVPYTGTTRTMEQFGKKEDAQTKLAGDAAAAKTLVEKAAASPKSFGITPALASKLPNFIGAEITARSLTPEQMQTRNDVMRQAAIIIHSIYGAALTRGEGGRANTWAVAPDDNFEATMSKLKSAQAYAEDAANREAKLSESRPASAPAAPAKALPTGRSILPHPSVTKPISSQP